MISSLSNKAYFMLLCSFLIFVSFSFGQKVHKHDSKEIIFDGETQSFTGNPELIVNQDGKVLIRLININQFIYDVKIREIQNNSVSEEKLTNSEFSSSNLLIKRFERRLPNTYEPILINAKINPEVIRLIKEKEALLQRINQKEEDINDVYLLQEYVEGQIDHLKNESPDSSMDEILLLQKKMLKIDSFMQASSTEIKEFESQIEKNDEEIYNLTNSKTSQDIPLIEFQSAIEEYWRAYGRILDMKPFYESMLSIVQSDRSHSEISNDLGDLKYRSFYDNISDYEFPIYDDKHITEHWYDRLKLLRQSFSIVHSKFSNLILDDPLVDKEKMINALERVKENYDLVIDSDIELLIREIGSIDNAVNEENWNFVYETFVIDDKADKILYEIIVTPKASLSGIVKPQGYKRTVDVIIRKGWKIDGSAGFLFNMSWFGFSDSTYFFKALSDSTTQIISQRQNQQFLPNLALMFTVYPRSAWNCKPGLGFGVSTNTESLKYYLGGVLVLGRSERINLCAGMVGGRVARISDVYDPSVIINQNRADLEESVPMMDPAPFRFGVYFGVTFNFIGASNSSRLNGVIGN